MKVGIRVAFWVKPYLQAVALWATITGRVPDYERIRRTISRGVRPWLT